MKNEHKVINASSEGFTVQYVDTLRHFNYSYDRPLLPHLEKIYNELYKSTARQHYEKDPFNPLQNKLYKEVVYGLSSYSASELKMLSLCDKLKIKHLNNLAQRVLNVWKQELIASSVDDFLLSLFPRSQTIKKFVALSNNYTDQRVVNTCSFSELGITKKDIALKLISAGLLPKNFFENSVCA